MKGPKPKTHCSKCGQLKTGRNGRACKPCHAARAREKYRANPEAAREISRRWKAANKVRTAAYDRERYAIDPERAQAASRRWRSANPEAYRAVMRAVKARRRAAAAGAAGSFSPAEWRAIVNKQRGRCTACSRKAKLEADHIVPLSRGGSGYAFNIQGLCRRCNASKNARLDSGAQHTLFDRTDLAS